MIGSINIITRFLNLMLSVILPIQWCSEEKHNEPEGTGFKSRHGQLS